MEYTLYIGKKCHQCQDMIEFLRVNKVSFRTVHVQKDKERPPIDLFIFPALMHDDRLLCYGTDIVNYIEAKQGSVKQIGMLGKMRIFMTTMLNMMAMMKDMK